MATPNLVPSRALLHTLRGILFTTSCSVAILAEERRRRIKVARSALENARKLHTIGRGRGPVSLAEYEDRLSNLGAPPIDIPCTKNVRRRRREVTIGSNISLTSHGSPPSATSPGSESPARNTAPGHASLDSAAVHHRERTSSGLSFASSRQNDGLRVKARANQNSSIRRSEALRKPGQQHNAQLGRERAPTDATKDTPDSILDSTSDSVGRRVDIEFAALLRILETPGTDFPTVSATTDKTVLLLANYTQSASEPGTDVCPSDVHCVRLLRFAASIESTRVSQVLEALAPHPRLSSLMIDFVRWLGTELQHQSLRLVLTFLAEAGLLHDGMIIFDALSSSSHRHESTGRLYATLKRAGLFQDFSLADKAEHKILQKMVLEREGLSGGVLSALGSPEQPMLQTTKIAIRTRCSGIIRDAKSGSWTSIDKQIEELSSRVKPSLDAFQRLLQDVVDQVALQQVASALEKQLRQYMVMYSVTLKPSWVYRVLGFHCRKRDLESTISWLEFCSDNNFNVQQNIEELWKTTLRPWGFTSATYRWFQEKNDSVALTALEQRESSAGPSASQTEDALFVRMDLMARARQWRDIQDEYLEAAHPAKGYVSDRCFRLYIVALIADKGAMEGAMDLIQQAQHEGHNVSGAMMAMADARLQRGDDPFETISHTKQLGGQIHDSMWNSATRRLLEASNLRGAIDMCKWAAKENGDGEPAYTGINFSNLVFAYTGSCRYEELEDLIWKLISLEQATWRRKEGNRVCIKVLKLALKTTERRIETDYKKAERHRRANAHLAEALRYLQHWMKVARFERDKVLAAIVCSPHARLDPRKSAMTEEVTDDVDTVSEASEEVQWDGDPSCDDGSTYLREILNSLRIPLP